MVISIRYASIRSMDISNGEGVGIALFVQGCHLHCPNCFNPETWDFNSGKEWTKEVKNKFLELVDKPYIKRVSILGGEPLAEENIDDVLDLVTEINKRYNIPQDRAYAKDENNNILTDFSDKIRLSSTHKSIWLYSGYTWEQLFEDDDFDINGGICENQTRRAIVLSSDVFVDGRYIDSQKDLLLKWRGSKNQKVIDAQKSLQQGKVVLWCN